MREIAESHSWSVPAVALFEEDVETLGKLLSSNAEPARVLSGRYEFEGGVAELRSKRGYEPGELELRGAGSGVCLTLRPKAAGSHLFSDGSQAAEDAFLRVREFLLQRQRWHNRVPTAWQVWFGAWAVSTMLIAVRITTGTKWSPWVSVAPYALVVPAAVFAPFRRNRIVLRPRHESAGFWMRKKDDILLLVLGAVVGAVVGAFLTWVLKG